MTDVIIYLGPSLPLDVAKQILPEAIFRPPIRKGNIDSNPSSPQLIGIIDGAIAPMIKPKEVLRALFRGITVLGASGIGALRAVELCPYGMIGIGTIFDWFKTGYLQNDDAVICTYDPQTYQRFSEPQVNMIYALSQATQDNIIKPKEQQLLLQITHQIYYPNRTYELFFSKADATLSRRTLLNLKQYLSKRSFDLQQQDAIQLLKSIPYHLQHPPDPSEARPIYGLGTICRLPPKEPSTQ